MINIKTRLNTRKRIFKACPPAIRTITRGATETFVFDIDKYNEKYNKEYTADNFYQVSFLFKQGDNVLQYTSSDVESLVSLIDNKFILNLPPAETIKFNETCYYNFDEYDLLKYEVVVQVSETNIQDPEAKTKTASTITTIEDSCFIAVKDSIYADIYKEHVEQNKN